MNSDRIEAGKLGPLQVSEIILRTMKFEPMKAWYQRLFGG